MANWWRTELNPQGLSQGDVIQLLISGSAVVPVRALQNRPLRGGKPGWEELTRWSPGNNDVGHYLAAGKMLPCLVISHSCDLEKPKETARVHIAPIRPLTAFAPEERELVLQRSRANLVPLSDIPGWDDSCADLRCISYVDRRMVEASERVVSMTEEGTKIFQAQLVFFFTRILIPSDVFNKAT